MSILYAFISSIICHATQIVSRLDEQIVPTLLPFPFGPSKLFGNA